VFDTADITAVPSKIDGVQDLEIVAAVVVAAGMEGWTASNKHIIILPDSRLLCRI
jgi:hypothetical protein